jgi:hypothetical protein
MKGTTVMIKSLPYTSYNTNSTLMIRIILRISYLVRRYFTQIYALKCSYPLWYHAFFEKKQAGIAHFTFVIFA